jgi:hypothetical protein
VAALDASFGIVRGTSNFVDAFPQYSVTPPVPIRSTEDVNAFSAYCARTLGLATREDELLTGDAALISRALLDKAGVFDTRFFGYFGDVDFGLRARRAGFKMVCALGAWLFHERAGYYRDEAVRRKVSQDVVDADRMRVVNAAYQVFRAKWDPTMPENYPGTAALPLEGLRSAKIASPDYQPPVPIDAARVEML